MPRIHLVLSDVQHKWLETHSDSLRTKSAIIRDLINAEIKGLDATPRLSAYHVGAGEKVLKEVSEVQTSILPKKNSPDGDLGESVGREREGTPRKPLLKKSSLKSSKFTKKPFLITSPRNLGRITRMLGIV